MSTGKSIKLFQHIVSVIENNDTDFIACIKEQPTESIQEVFDSTKASEHSCLFSALHGKLQKHVETIQHFTNEEAETQSNADREKCYDESIHFVEATICIVEAFIKDDKRKASNSLVETVHLLHDIIFQIHSTTFGNYPHVPNKIASICERWWSQDRSGKENIVPQTISFLLVRALDQGGKTADVQRVYDFRSALLLIDFQDESSVSLKRLLMRCLIHPLFLRNKKGQLFLVYLFGLYPPFIDELHNTIKAQISSSCRKSVLEIYGEIYFKAWKVASGPYLVKIEYSCLQDLMSSAIHVADTNVAASIRKVLSIIHSKKKNKGVDQMLLRLYEPILWRSLNVANPLVRRNAATILVESFPLQDPDAPQRETDELLQKQFSTLESLLYDTSLAVRSAVVPGVFHILNTYWELIPEQTIRVLIAHLINDLAHDASSSAVRAAVLDGLRYLLDNHLSQPMLKVLLPSLSPLLHDTAEKVRVAFVDLLTSVKTIRSIRFYDIVPVDQLLHRLAADKCVTKKLTSLLLNSYFPYNKETAVQIKRCIVLVQTNKHAATAFYSCVPNFVPVAPICKFIGQLQKYISKAISKEQEQESEKAVDMDTMEKLIEIMGILWEKVDTPLQKEENKQLKEYLESCFTDETLKQMLTTFQNPVIQKPIFTIASHIPQASVPQFSTNCINKLHQLKSGNTEDYEHLLECLFMWKFGDQVLTAVQQWISEPFTSQETVTTKPAKNKGNAKRAKRSSETTERTPSNRPILALKVIQSILSKESLRALMLTYTDNLRELMKDVLQYFIPIQRRLSGDDKEKDRKIFSDELLLLALETYCKVFLHIYGCFDELEKDFDPLRELVEWSREFLATVQSAAPFTHSIVVIVFRVCTECVAFDFCTSQMQQQIQELCNIFVQRAATSTNKELSTLLPVVFKLSYQLYLQGEDKRAWDSLQKALLACDQEMITEHGSTIRLNDVLSLHYQQDTLHTFLKDLGQLILSGVQVPTDVEQMELSEEHLQPIVLFTLNTVIKSQHWLAALCGYLNQFLSQTEKQTEKVWKVLEILRVLLYTDTKVKPDISSLQNSLISIISKLPDQAIDTESDIQPDYLRKIANSLLKESYTTAIMV